MKHLKLFESESRNGYIFDDDTKNLATDIRMETMILEMIIGGYGKGSLEDINIEDIIENLKKLKMRIESKKYNL